MPWNFILLEILSEWHYSNLLVWIRSQTLLILMLLFIFYVKITSTYVVTLLEKASQVYHILPCYNFNVFSCFSRNWYQFNKVFSTKFRRYFSFSDFCLHTYNSAVNMEFICPKTLHISLRYWLFSKKYIFNQNFIQTWKISWTPKQTDL